MKAGLLTDKVKITRPTFRITDTGAQVETMTEVGTYRCHVKHGRGFRQVANNQIFYAKSVYFTMRWQVDVKYTDILIYNSEKYRVLAIEYRREDDSVEVTSELCDE